MLAYEPVTNHDSKGMHVLYGDGTVKWLPRDVADRVITRLNAGHNPPGR